MRDKTNFKDNYKSNPATNRRKLKMIGKYK